MASSVPEKTARFPECLEHGVGALAEYGQVGQHPALRQDGQAAALELQVLRPEQYGFTSSSFSIADPHRITSLFPNPRYWIPLLGWSQ